MSAMPANDAIDAVDWSLTTWDGARREQLRRWADLPLENIVAALEEMQALAQQLGPAGTAAPSPRKPQLKD